jgi:hypothetical protein
VPYTVSLTVTSAASATSTATKSAYVTAVCQVPNLAGVKANNADTIWSGAGFTTAVTKSQNGNFTIKSQSIAGGTLNPPSDCDAQITVGP